MRKHAIALIIGAALSIGSTSAQATPYTLLGSQAFGPEAGATGSIDPVGSFAGTTICLAGTCGTNVTHDWLVFTVTVTSGYLDEIGVARGLPAATVVGLGYYDADPGLAPQATSYISPSTLARFDYGIATTTTALNLGDFNNVGVPETSRRLFVVFALGDLPGPGQTLPFPSAPGRINFMLSAATDLTTIPVVIPEPGTLLLLGAGLIGMGFAGSRRRLS